MRSRDPTALENAIGGGETAGLLEDELKPARRMLGEERRKARARDDLRNAEASGDLS